MLRRNIDHALIEGLSRRQGGDRYICRRRGRAYRPRISRPSGVAVLYGAVMHIMGGMCTCRGSQLFDTAAGRFAIRAAAYLLHASRIEASGQVLPFHDFAPCARFSFSSFPLTRYRDRDILMRQKYYFSKRLYMKQ